MNVIAQIFAGVRTSTATLLACLAVFACDASAGLRLDCSDLTPKQMKAFKSAPKQDPCAGKGDRVVAVTSIDMLYLCEEGTIRESYDIAIGRGGIGKTKLGDNKTPLGTYPLSSPRKSERFGLFIPVGYPTNEQKAEGLTGADVGIHGPDRLFACAGVLNVSFNWTAGCLALADDRFLLDVANFVESHKPILLDIVE